MSYTIIFLLLKKCYFNNVYHSLFLRQLVVSIVAVLVVAVASQARHTKQQNDDNGVLTSIEERHPRFINRPVTASSTEESIIMRNLQPSTMRVVTPDNFHERAFNATGQIRVIGVVDTEPSYSVSYVIARRK